MEEDAKCTLMWWKHPHDHMKIIVCDLNIQKNVQLLEYIGAGSWKYLSNTK